jgi:hypothetical protein
MRTRNIVWAGAAVTIIVLVGIAAFVVVPRFAHTAAKVPPQPATIELVAGRTRKQIAEAYFTERNALFRASLEPQERERASLAERRQTPVVIEALERMDRIMEKKRVDGPPRLKFEKATDMKVGKAAYVDYIKAVQIIDQTTALGSVGGELAMFRGFSTQGIVDGQVLARNRSVLVTEITNYKTALGATKTVFVVEPFDLDQWEAEFGNIGIGLD